MSLQSGRPYIVATSVSLRCLHPTFILLFIVQVYLGGYDSEAQAALAYDLAAVKYRGTSAQTNFELSSYQRELNEEGLKVSSHAISNK